MAPFLHPFAAGAFFFGGGCFEGGCRLNGTWHKCSSILGSAISGCTIVSGATKRVGGSGFLVVGGCAGGCIHGCAGGGVAP